ncbi:MAG TPA: NAD(P)-binding domain-containing protein [Planctomycetota bacterium]|nr:NAD(P)-binding domain-containing protein [Planctomycetota bacterium]
MRVLLRDRERVSGKGGEAAALRFPVIDRTRCLGCATCVASCPEEGVLDIVHGQAMVIHGARCVGVSACERECPVGAITVTRGDWSQRNDVPVLTPDLEAVEAPGLFLAGEVTAHALIKSAVDQGTQVGRQVVRRVAAHTPRPGDPVLDLCVVGVGPAGLACSMVAREAGLRFVTLDQEHFIGGTVAKYPRRKLVLSQAFEMPGAGRFDRRTYEKEELMEMWQLMAQDPPLPLVGGQEFQGLERSPAGHFVVRTQNRTFEARNVCLAIGRRGIPRKLEVPGEDLPKVAYHLVDAHSYQQRRILVVGGGDSAVEAALALAEQPGNRVTLSYRGSDFFRIRTRNEQRLLAARDQGHMDVCTQSQVTRIEPASVTLSLRGESGAREVVLDNDDVFVMVGGIAPLELLSNSGVTFDGHEPSDGLPPAEAGSGLTKALWIASGAVLATLAVALWHWDYYGAEPALRAAHPKHDLLGPSKGLGLALGIAACGLIVFNLLYLIRRAPGRLLNWGSLRTWMTSHVATGIAAPLLALLHGSLDPGDSLGGHALLALGVLVVTGAIGRYLYAYIPRAANGRELELSEFKADLGQLGEEWDEGLHAFRSRVREKIVPLVEDPRWQGSLPVRFAALLKSRWKLGRELRELERIGRAMEVRPEDLAATLTLARAAHRSATMAHHYEELRALLGTWRYLHRWVAAGMVLLVVVHVAYAWIYGFRDGSGVPR